jgi:hypothetical protein
MVSCYGFSQSHFNSSYCVSDVIVINGIMNAMDQPDLLEAQKQLMAEVRIALNETPVLIMALTSVLWRAHFGNHMDREICGETRSAPNLFEFALPFFVDTSRGAADYEHIAHVINS